MRSYFKNTLGIDSGVFWILANKTSMLVKGPLTVAFIVMFLTPEQQGIWYTFISLAAISILAELGFTAIITQFVSHEFAGLGFSRGFISGRRLQRDRLFSLIRYAIKFYIVIVPAATAIMLIAGLYVLDSAGTEIKVAWGVFSIVSALNLLVNLFQSVYQGLDKVAPIHRARTIGSWLTPLTCWPLLALGFHVWALVLSTLASVLTMFWLLNYMAAGFWQQVIRHKETTRHAWFHELVVLQGKYALSWASGYLIFSLFVPVAYKVFGATVAGQMGITINLLQAINSIAASWLDARIPQFNILVAKKDKDGLDKLFWRSAAQGYIVQCLGVMTLLGLAYLANLFSFYNTRLLSLKEIFLLVASNMAVVMIGFFAKYLRAHKAEPFYLLSVLNGVIVAAAVLLIMPNFGIDGLFYSLIVIYWAIILPIAIAISKKFVRRYYNVA